MTGTCSNLASLLSCLTVHIDVLVGNGTGYEQHTRVPSMYASVGANLYIHMKFENQLLVYLDSYWEIELYHDFQIDLIRFARSIAD